MILLLRTTEKSRAPHRMLAVTRSEPVSFQTAPRVHPWGLFGSELPMGRPQTSETLKSGSLPRDMTDSRSRTPPDRFAVE